MVVKFDIDSVYQRFMMQIQPPDNLGNAYPTKSSQEAQQRKVAPAGRPWGIPLSSFRVSCYESKRHVRIGLRIDVNGFEYRLGPVLSSGGSGNWKTWANEAE